MKESDIDKVKVGSLIQYTHFGRHETTKATGIVMEVKEWKFRNTYADIRWFDGLARRAQLEPSQHFFA